MLGEAKRLARIMETHRLEALVATCPSNVAYLTDYSFHARLEQGAPYENQIFALVCADAPTDVCLVAPLSAAGAVANRPSACVKRMISYGADYMEIKEDTDRSEDEARFVELLHSVERVPSPVAGLGVALEHAGLSNARVGLDEYGVSPRSLNMLLQTLPNLQVTFATDVFREARMVKTETEVQRIQIATRIVENAIIEVLGKMDAGMSTEELRIALKTAMVENGAVPYLWTVTSKMHQSAIDERWDSCKLATGDLVFIDAGCRYDGYYSDVARTTVIGEPNGRQQAYYRAVLSGEAAILESIRPGVQVSELFRTGVDTVRKSGIPHFKRRHCGHGIGLSPYDPPVINEQCNTILEEGMVLCIETPYYELGFGGIVVEDTIVVTASGCQWMTSLPRGLTSIGEIIPSS